MKKKNTPIFISVYIFKNQTNLLSNDNIVFTTLSLYYKIIYKVNISIYIWRIIYVNFKLSIYFNIITTIILNIIFWVRISLYDSKGCLFCFCSYIVPNFDMKWRFKWNLLLKANTIFKGMKIDIKINCTYNILQMFFIFY
jgi:hypothetical protein